MKYFGKLLVGMLLMGIITLVMKYSFLERLPKTVICQDCNVVVILTDTLRVDHTQPILDVVAKSSLKNTHTLYNFGQAYSAAPWTLPSMMSIFTGTLPSTHGVVNKYLAEDEEGQVVTIDRTAPNIKLLAELLTADTYATAAFTGGAGIEGIYGFNRGFAEYYDKTNFAGFSETVPLAKEWLKHHKAAEKLFLVVHGYDVHGQYEPAGGYDYRYTSTEYNGTLRGTKDEQKELREIGLLEGKVPLTAEDAQFLEAIYREKIDRMSEHIQTLIEEVTANLNPQRTIIVVVSDHGEEFMEHGKIDHGHSLFNELLHVPLLVLLPKGIGLEKTLFSQTKFPELVQLDQQVRTIDIAPTIIELLGLETEATQQFEGLSLVPIIQGQEKEERLVLAETEYRYVADLESVQTVDQKKLIKNNLENSNLLFDLATDPGEAKNIIDTQPELVIQLEKLLFTKAR